MSIKDFSVIQILREINLAECRSYKNAVFMPFYVGALIFVILANFRPQKV